MSTRHFSHVSVPLTKGTSGPLGTISGQRPRPPTRDGRIEVESPGYPGERRTNEIGVEREVRRRVGWNVVEGVRGPLITLLMVHTDKCVPHPLEWWG